MIHKISIQSEKFDIAAEIAALVDGRHDIGAVVTFTGLCRDEGGRLSALELEHYPGMAEKKARQIAEDAIGRWSLTGLTIIHRYGTIVPGEDIVLVITASAHRREAFEAAEFLMDFMKTRAPFWKREHLVSGETGGWVDARTQDDEAVDRWHR